MVKCSGLLGKTGLAVNAHRSGAKFRHMTADRCLYMMLSVTAVRFVEFHPECRKSHAMGYFTLSFIFVTLTDLVEANHTLTHSFNH